jgi:hypothetical protein
VVVAYLTRRSLFDLLADAYTIDDTLRNPAASKNSNEECISAQECPAHPLLWDPCLIVVFCTLPCQHLVKAWHPGVGCDMR